MSKIMDEFKRQADAEDISMYEIAKRTGLTYATVWRMFHGQSNPSLKSVEKVAAALKLGVKKEPPSD